LGRSVANDHRARSAELRARRELSLLWASAALAVLVVSPLGPVLAGALPMCPLKSIAGLPCPGCGTTRAALALARFDLPAALAVNPLATVAWIGFIGGGFLAGAVALAGRPLREPSWKWSLPARLGIVAVVAANWLYLIWAGV